MTTNETAPRALGLDFGTTNTVLAWAHPHHPAEPVMFKYLTSPLFAFRSALCAVNDSIHSGPS